jgi:hypothetical protein
VKKLLSVFVAAAFVAGVAGFASAQTTAPAEKKVGEAEKKAGEKMEKAGEKMEKAGEKKIEKAEKKMASKHASGSVKSAGADSIVVAGKEKGKEAEWTFAVDPTKTKIKKGGKDITAADLKAGDSVQVRYTDMDGKMVATSVTVKGGGMAKKDGEAKPAEKPAEKK